MVGIDRLLPALLGGTSGSLERVLSLLGGSRDSH